MSQYRQLWNGQSRRRLDTYDRIAIGCFIGTLALIAAIALHWI
jgi:hypothetical protein